MKKIFLLVLAVVAFNAAAQTAGTSPGFNVTTTPQWVKDLRRGEIVAFGSFPFTFFFTSFAMDTVRTASNNWDGRYAPWPFKAPGAIDMTRDEQLLTIGIAVGSSILIAVVDYFITTNKRKKLEQQISSMPPGTPIIITRPMDGSFIGEESVLPSEDYDTQTAPETEGETE